MTGAELVERAKAGQGRQDTAKAVDYLLGLIDDLVDHLDWIGWGDSYERELVVAPGGLRDQAEEVLKGYVKK